LIKVSHFKQNGFTLIEVLIGLIILSIGILAVAGMQITSIIGTSFSNNLSQASVVAQDRIEFLKGLPLNDARLNDGTYNDGPIILPNGTFNRTYTSTRNVNPNFVTIVYTVTWLEKGVSHSVSFRTIKGR
jgi:type IV pilus assembly protein PilV